MTRKQWIILVLLLVSALVPILSSGKKSVKAPPPTPKKEISEDVFANTMPDDIQRSALSNETPKSANFEKADHALAKLSALAELGPAEEKRTADDILKDTQIQIPVFSQESQKASLAPTATPEVVVKEEETPPPAFSEESFSSEPAVKQPTSNSADVLEAEKLRLHIVSLEAKLNEQKHTFESRAADLKSKLDVQESENVKLSHQIQNAENNSADAQKLNSKVKDLELKLDKSRADLTNEKKRVDDSKTLRTEYSKRLAEEEKIRKSIEDQLELAVAKRDEQAKDNDKLRRVVGDFEKRVKLIEEQRLAVSEDKEQVLLKQLAALRKELTVSQGALDDLKKKQKAQSSEVSTTASKLEAMQKQLEDRQRENDDLSIKLATAERINEKSKDLQQELLAARNELMLAQEQVRTLMSTSKNPSYPRTESIQPPRNERPVVNVQATPVAATSDVLILEVTAQKAALRAGPGEENSTVMEIQQGSRLTVETREGDWYRVVTPKGQRAYLRADLAVELDANQQPRFSPPSSRSAKAGPRPTRTLNATAPNSDPLVELLGQQLKERHKNPTKGDSLDPDDGASPPAAPSAQPNPEDEMEAFEALKQGIKNEGN